MRYFILRNGQQFGPYSPPDLERYLAQGSILATDLARTEEMNQWTLLSQIMGNGTPPPPPSPVGSDRSMYAGFSSQLPTPNPTGGHGMCSGLPAFPAPTAPLPPGSLHWGLVLLFMVITFGLFGTIWAFVQANWVRKIDRQSKAILLLVIAVVLSVTGNVISLTGEAPLLALAVLLASITVGISAMFSMRASIVCHYNSVEMMGLRLSGAMTFFFGILYLQYHLHRILNAKLAGQPAQPGQTYPYARPA